MSVRHRQADKLADDIQLTADHTSYAGTLSVDKPAQQWAQSVTAEVQRVSSKKMSTGSCGMKGQLSITIYY